MTLSLRKFLAGIAVVGLVSGAAGIAGADTIGNNVDNTVDVAVENLNLTAGGATGSVKLRVVVDDNSTDPHNGCNISGPGAKLVLTATSSNPAVATVTDPANFTTCADDFTDATPPIGSEQATTVTPLTSGTTTITFAVDSSSVTRSGGVFRLDHATFTVTVTAGGDPCAGRTSPAAPTITETNAPDPTSGWYKAGGSAATFTLDPSQNAEYRIGSGSWTAYAGAVTLATDGEHSITARNFLPATTAPDCERVEGSVSDATVMKVDRTAPTSEVTGFATGSKVLLGNEPTPGCVADDLTSGVASHGSPTTTGGAGVGTKSVTCNGATDVAGNTQTAASAAKTYTVIFDFGGFQRPIDPLPTLNSVKAGSSVPIKFSLDGDQGMSIFAAGHPGSKVVTCGSTAAVDPVEEISTPGSSGLSYDSVNDSYNYVWKTDKGWAGTCRTLTIKLADGETYQANFKLLK